MPLPMPKNQVRRLGERLRDSAPPSADDLDLLSEVLAAYDDTLSRAAERLARLGLRASSRLKNTGTIVEKLRRERGTNLPNIQDLAGLRVFLADTDGRREQDVAVERIVDDFRPGDREPRVHDRRADPSRGYRAVHVVVHLDDVPVEIQVRTPGQHQWAELFERLADLWGRDIRYPDGAPDIERLLVGLDPASADALRPELQRAATSQIDGAQKTADLIARLEALEVRLVDRAETAQLWDEVRGLLSTWSARVAAMDSILERIRELR